MTDIPELLDRLAIAEVKFARTSDECLKAEIHARTRELDRLCERDESVGSLLKLWLWELKVLHNEIWDFENPLRRGKPADLANKRTLRDQLPEFTEHEIFAAGIAALHVRKINRRRVSLRNKIVERLGEGFKDIAQNGVAPEHDSRPRVACEDRL